MIQLVPSILQVIEIPYAPGERIKMRIQLAPVI